MVLTQFSPVEGKQTLFDFFRLPKDVYPVGRLDYDSEGLLLLTNDSSINQRLLHPKNKHQRTYLVQVEGAITDRAIQQLQTGVIITIDGKPHHTLHAEVHIITAEPLVPSRYPPIRIRKNIPVSWIQLTLTEGKNRQVRRMTAKVGFPTLRLIRTRIGHLQLHDMQPGNIKELSRNDVYKALF